MLSRGLSAGEALPLFIVGRETIQYMQIAL